MAYTTKDKEYYEKNREKILAKQRERYHSGAGIAVKRAYLSNNKETISDAAKKYRQENKEVISERNRVAYLKNKENRKENQRAYYKKNRRSLLAGAKKYYMSNRDDIRDYQNTWAKTETGLKSGRARCIRRRARKLEAEGNFTAEAIKDLYATQGGRCYYCSTGIEKYHIDHMTPLTREGSNWPENLCLTCVKCNLTKHTKTAEEFIEHSGFMYGI